MSPFQLRTTLGAAAVATALVIAPPARAYEAKHAPSGKPVHWPSSTVDFVASPTLHRAADDAEGAIARALAAWDGAAGAPSLRARLQGDAPAPAYDGTNVITYAPAGFAGAGGALAVTILTYDDDTGAILDCDIVLNGKYEFAVLDDSARAAKGALGVSTEGGGSFRGPAPFDLVHVFAHEAGHALGLSDEPGGATALMYPLTMPGDASSRLPSDDDLAGVSALYASSGGAAAGCTLATGPAFGGSAPFLLSGLALIVPYLRRRRSRGTRAGLVAAGAFLTWAAIPSGASAASAAVREDVSAEITSSHVVLRDGVFTTELTFAIRACPLASCPSFAHATVWGGHAGGVTQELAGAAVPVLGQSVAISLDPLDTTAARLVIQ